MFSIYVLSLRSKFSIWLRDTSAGWMFAVLRLKPSSSSLQLSAALEDLKIIIFGSTSLT